MKLLILALVQGLTEFLPVSSSGHLLILEKLMGVQANLGALNIFLHGGTFFAIVLYFHKQWIRLLALNHFKNRVLLGKVLIISAITFVVATLLKQQLTTEFLFLGFLFLLNSFVIFSIRLYRSNKRKQIGFIESIFLGIVQGFAIFPGISRSGMTISFLLWRKLSLEEAFNFSFLIALPVLGGSFILEVRELLQNKSALGNISSTELLSATGLSFVAGFLSLILFKKLLHSKHFKYFGVYTFIVAILCFALEFYL